MSSREEELARKRAWIDHVYTGSINDTHAEPRPSSNPLPSFFLIGPPRTGTTWLYEILRDHSVLPAPTKETRFFDQHFHRGIEWYQAHFPAPVAGRHIGEIAPTYFASPQASERISKLLPQAKVVCVFRNPVERVLSLYKLKCSYGLIPWTFEQAMLRDPELLGSSRYATRLKEWQRALGQSQVLALVYDDLLNEPQSFLDTLLKFVGIPRFELAEHQTQCVHASESMTYPRSYHRTRGASAIADWFKARRLDKVVATVRNSPLQKLFLGGGPAFPKLPADVVERLYELFRPEVDELEGILDRDLSTWKSMRERLIEDFPIAG